MYYSFEEVWKANAYKYPKGECQVCGARQFSMMPIDKTRSDDHKLNYNKFYLSIKEKFLYIEGGRAQEEAAQEGCGVSLSGDIQNIPGYIPGSPAVGDSALSGGWTG